MFAHPRALLVAGTVVGVLVLPAAAGAATKVVTMGPPSDHAEDLQRYAADVNAFFPRKVTIRVGDTVQFVPHGFHNADVPPRGQGGTPLLAPTGEAVAGAVDAAGAPFWFNGQPQLGFDPSLLDSKFGDRVTFDGRDRVNSGLPLGENPRPFAVRFTRAGTYEYFCDVHPGMRGTVRVLPKRSRVPSRRADARAVERQARRAVRTAQRLSRVQGTSGVVELGVAGPGGVERFAMVPESVTVAPGTTLRFQMSRGSFEVHTATFGPGNPETEPTSYLGRLTASFESPVIDPIALYPSDAPGSPNVVTSTTHGNGFWNTGVLDPVDATPLPSAATAQFTEPGTYTFYCLVHPFMRGTVVVR